MNTEELENFLKNRPESSAVGYFNTDSLFCYGCAHSASGKPFPGEPSGERPCCSCVRNKEREQWLKDKAGHDTPIVVDNEGNARTFDAFAGTLYNGAPRVRFPMDNYVTLDSQEQSRWLEGNEAYAKPISFVDGVPTILR